MRTDDPVRRALEALANADTSRRVPPHIERAVVEAFDRQSERKDRRWRVLMSWDHRRGMAVVAAATVVIGVVTTIYFLTAPRAGGRLPGPERAVQSPVSGGTEMPPALGNRAEPESFPTQPRSRPQVARRSRTRAHRSVTRTPELVTAVWRPSDDIIHSVRVRVPRAMLPELGVPVIDPDAPGTVTVELVVGSDGLPRTIRIVR
jgi:hypothetical protein